MLLPQEFPDSVSLTLVRNNKKEVVLSMIAQIIDATRMREASLADVKLNGHERLLKISEQLDLLRFLQLARIIDPTIKVGCLGRRKCYILKSGPLFDVARDIINSIGNHKVAGAALIWMAFLYKGTLPNALMAHALKDARPRTRIIAPEIDNPNAYERLVMEMYEHGIFNWPKSIGVIRGRYISIFKPVNDAMLALALASITGLLLLQDVPGQPVAVITDRNSLTPSRRKTLRNLLGDFIPARELLEDNPSGAPLWQRKVKELVLG